MVIISGWMEVFSTTLECVILDDVWNFWALVQMFDRKL